MKTERWDRSYDFEVVDIRGSWRDDLFLALWALQGPALSLRTRKLNQNSLRLIGLKGRTRAWGGRGPLPFSHGKNTDASLGCIVGLCA